jgi:integrase
VAGLTRAKFSDWFDSLTKASGEEMQPQTLKNYRTVAYTFFEYCIEKDWLGNNPAEKVKAPKVIGLTRDLLHPCYLMHAFDIALRSDSVELLKRPLRQDERDDLIVWLALGSFQGIRASEIQRLTWKNIRLNIGKIVLEAHETKNGKKRSFPLTRAATQWLKSISNREGNLVAPNFASSRALRSLRATLKQRLNIEWPNNVLRRSFASYHLELHNDANLTSMAMGHGGDPRLLYARYADAVDDVSLPIKWFNILPKPVDDKIVKFSLEAIG